MDKVEPRKKQPDESKKENLLRRLEEHMEFVQARKHFSTLSFYEELHKYIEEEL